jgi:hypothetical protein
MSSRLRAVVEPEDAHDDSTQFVGQLDRSGASSVRPPSVAESFEFHTEGRLESFDGSAHANRSPSGGLFDHVETVAIRELSDRFDIAFSRAMHAGEIFSWNDPAVAQALGCEREHWGKGFIRRTSTEQEGYRDLFVRVGRT